MKAVEFPEVNIRFAENQEQYATLPAKVNFDSPEKEATFCFELDEEEIEQIVKTGKLYLGTLTFGRPINPIGMSALRPHDWENPGPSKNLKERLNNLVNKLL